MTKPAPSGAFLREARRVLNQLQSACRDLVGAVEPPVRTAADLERALGVNKKVAWQVFKIAEATDPLSAARFVPGRDPMRRMISAVEDHGLKSDPLSSAFDAFEAVVETHAGDRASLMSMIGPSSAPTDDPADVDRLHLRAAYRAAVHFYGAAIDHRFHTTLVRPGQDGTRDFVSLRGRIGLRRMRADATPLIERHATTTPDDNNTGSIARPLDLVAAAQHGAALLPSFCSKPLPKLVACEEDSGVRRIELTRTQVGLTGAVDLVFATIAQGVPTLPSTPEREHGFHAMVRIDQPVAKLQLDMLVHQDIRHGEPRLSVHADPTADISTVARESSPTLPTNARIEALGRGTQSAACDYPRYGELVGYTCALLGWDADEFALYRVVMDYPLNQVVVRFWFPS